jgi:predicted GH43/DUF377 family glycosyl hydrolase
MSELLIPGTIHYLKPPTYTTWKSNGKEYIPVTTWFNPTIVEAWGLLWILFRHNNFPNYLTLNDLTSELELGEKDGLTFIYNKVRNPEDARAVFLDNQIHVLFAGAKIRYEENWIYLAEGVKTFHGILDFDGRMTEEICHYVHSQPVEKNWVPFVLDNKLYAVYHSQPFTILKSGKEWNEVYKAEAIKWDYGQIRGGAIGTKDGLYYHFFHSSRWLENPCERVEIGLAYDVGCYVFDQTFKIIKQTEQPIMSGAVDEPDAYTVPNRYPYHSTVFPCGAIYHNNKWLVSYGWQDSKARIAEFNNEDLNRALNLEK